MKQLHRRTFLRGIGTAVALPYLEAMMPSQVLAMPASKKTDPLRMAFFYVPNGVNVPEWTPQTAGTNFALPSILQPLEKHRDRLLVLSGLTADKARPNGDGPGDHARALSAFLTGCQPKKTHGADIQVGISVDQYAAKIVGHQTRFPSLELGIDRGAQAGNCDSGYSCAYSSAISWSSESTPVAKEVNPRLVFERLFSNGVTREVEEREARRQRYNKSIIDFVKEDARLLQSQLGTTDRRKLEEYLTGVREVEHRIARATYGTDVIVGIEKPAGVPDDFAEHATLMLDLLTLAFQGDLTRIATFMFANEGSNRSYRTIEVTDGHHNLSHHQGDADKLERIRKINHYHMTLFAGLIEKLKAIPEGQGSLLDNCMLVYGSGIGDGNRHNHDELPIVVLGKGAGTIKTGRHVRYPQNTPLNNLWVSLLDRMKVPVENLGDSTGRLDQLTIG